ncbi:MAG TPA: acyl-CoA dehydrogenase family protein [Pseudomonadales bacterium]|nr:acyl-CoA dehydrogenase family protein [Pseudomonadales bacterium]
MNLEFSSEDLAFQQEVRAWVDENLTEDMRAVLKRSATGHLGKELQIEWQKRLAARGWSVPNWPAEWGGPDWSATQKYIFDLEMSRVGAPRMLPFGATMVAPVIMKFGTEEQKNKYLPDIRESKVWWCQGYSEPGSGSDLASLSTTAKRDGDHYIVNGTKTWTTLGQYADMIFCLVRTSKEEKRQEGISFLLIDMKSEGITVDPIVTLDVPAKGHQEINTVFFENVKVPVENLVGEEGKGWTCAKYLLEFERGNAYAPGLKAKLGRIRDYASNNIADGAPLIEDASFARRMTEIEIEVSAMEFKELRILSALSSGQNVGPESSMLKCRGTELQQAVAELALESVGNKALPFAHPAPQVGINEEPVFDWESANAPLHHFNIRKASIYAGSNEVQRNIMAKLVLGL